MAIVAIGGAMYTIFPTPTAILQMNMLSNAVDMLVLFVKEDAVIWMLSTMYVGPTIVGMIDVPAYKLSQSLCQCCCRYDLETVVINLTRIFL